MVNKAPFCASLRLTRTVFSWLLKKAVSMALCTMATLCGKSSLIKQSLSRTPSRLKTSMISVAKNPLNLRNPRLKVRPKGLHNFAFYILIFNFSPCLRAFCAFLWLKNPFNQRNLRLMKYLCAFGTSTLVESALQIHPFLQNKANFQKVK